MNPQQPSTGGYDFILNPQQPKRSFSLPTGGVQGKGALIGVGVVVLVLVIFIAYSLFGGSGFNGGDATSVAQAQQEIVRVATEAGPNTTQAGTSAAAINAQLTIATQQKQLLAYLGKHNVKLSAKILGLKQNASTDQQLTTAQQNSTYDTTYAQILQTQLQQYATTLATAYKAATGPIERGMLATDYSQTQLLLKQVGALQNQS